MALQGSIDTFALADVLRLLASTSKTGRLSLEGDRGRGEVAVLDGAVAAVAAVGLDRPHAAIEEELFELLRFEAGDFSFEADDSVRADGATEGHEVEHLLAQAEGLLAEWRQIEAIVPSMAARVALRAELPAEQVTIGADGWRTIVAVGSGTTVGALGSALSATELGVGRQVRDLVELGVLVVAAAVTGPGTEVPGVPEVTEGPEAHGYAAPGSSEAHGHRTPEGPEATQHPVAEPASPLAPPAAEVDVVPPASWFEGGTPTDHMADGDEAVHAEQSGADPFGGEPFGPDEEEAGAADFARQLATLSPKAAKAVAAAAMAPTPEERDRVLAEVAGEEAIDHALLLRFLGADQD